MRTGLLALALAAAAAPAAGQVAVVRFAPPAHAWIQGGDGSSEEPGWRGSRLRESLSSPGGAFAASLLVPGAGQAALGLRRWPLYVVVEAGLWWLWADARGDYLGYRSGYRDLAWEAARIQEEPRRDGGWPYYEAMSHYVESGLFDTDPVAGIQPEEDPTTYNGSVWEVARGIFLPGGSPSPGSPEHAAALAWYEERAAGPGFLWSWAGREGDLDRFRALIGRADDAHRTRTTAFGVILANHLVSAIDGLVAARLRAATGADLNTMVIPGSAGPALRLELRVPLAH
ncbi:MAG: hypothetical protein KY466_15610 [Gemmatimonadetes bacterium]|nr:hypothetical protein [Gemmatimonadota bacterium]